VSIEGDRPIRADIGIGPATPSQAAPAVLIFGVHLNLGHLESDVAAMVHNLDTDFDQLLAQVVSNHGSPSVGITIDQRICWHLRAALAADGEDAKPPAMEDLVRVEKPEKPVSALVYKPWEHASAWSTFSYSRSPRPTRGETLSRRRVYRLLNTRARRQLL
jgi:hypothetical protein